MSKDTDKTVRNVKAGPQAKADVAAGAADAPIVIDVLANDLGGSAKALWSLDQTDPATSTAAGDSITLASGAQVRFADGQLIYDPGDAWDALDAGVQASETFSYAIRLSSGVVSTSTVTVTITGTDDAPVIEPSRTVAAGTVTELADRVPGENTFIHAAAGTIAFDDPDAGDVYSATFAPEDGGVGYLGTFALDAVDQAGDSVGWTFTMRDGLIDNLAVGETLVQRYDVTLDDGRGGAVSQTVTVTLAGTNDAPIFIPLSFGDARSVTELPDGAANENGFVHHAAAIVSYGDIDFADTHTLRFEPQNGGVGYLGTFDAKEIIRVVVGGTIQWDFHVDDSALDFLEAGQRIDQKYDLIVTDPHGAIAVRTITVTLFGTDDDRAMPMSGLAEVMAPDIQIA